MRVYSTSKCFATMTLALTLLSPTLLFGGSNKKQKDIAITPIGTYSTRVFDGGAAEIVAHDPLSQRLFVVNGHASSIDVLGMSNAASPTLVFSIDVSPYGNQANSVDVRDGVVAAAVEASPKTDPGKVVFFDTNGEFLNAVTVGSLPDMITFTPNGQKVLVANEGEPNDSYTIDPEGSVSVIDFRPGVAQIAQSDVQTAGFGAFALASLDTSIRIFGPGASVAQDLEPEYVTVSHDSKTAWVTLQENNAIGVLDLTSNTFTQLRGLGFKNHPGNICLERIGGIVIYDLSEPTSPRFVQYVNNPNFAIDPPAGTVAGTVGDLGPEGLIFIQAEESSNGKPLLVVANEVSGTTTIYQIAKAD